MDTINNVINKEIIIKANNMSFDVFIDDEIPNIRDIRSPFRDNLISLFITSHGYNENMPKELKFLIEAKGGMVTYYEPFTQEK